MVPLPRGHLLLATVLLAGLALACGPAVETPDPQPDATAVSTASAGAASPGAIIPTATPAPRATFTPEPNVPETKVDRPELFAILDSVNQAIQDLPASFNPRVNQRNFIEDRVGFSGEFNRIKAALETGNTQEAQDIIRTFRQKDSAIETTGLLNKVVNLGDPLNSKFVPADLKAQHDPENEWIKKDRVDPRILEDFYLPMIDVLIAVAAASQ